VEGLESEKQCHLQQWQGRDIALTLTNIRKGKQLETEDTKGKKPNFEIMEIRPGNKKEERTSRVRWKPP
jgi:hypothetical protein